ncbi:hypothetical protein [Stenotrophomonas sp. Ste96]|uniref:hypothetical protein n=1 Tax=Stenotrophomonas sp. Ste96 TaxID=2926029 RepID=UPI0021C7B966|nr:hypothetical protein [Stenotrophomonas sp. Ste96]
MALALLELTETSTGDVLEQLLSIPIAEAKKCQQAVSGRVVSTVRLYAEIGSNLLGVTPIIRSRLECAAMSCLDQVAGRQSNALQGASVTFTALWRDGVLQQLQSQSLADSIAVWSRQPNPREAYVLFDLRSLAPTEMSTAEGQLELLYGRLRDNVTRHIQFCRGHRSSLSLI